MLGSDTETQTEQLGPYRLREVLGRGGGGVVYRAEHKDTGRQVALKTVQVADAARLSILRREIHALSRIRHPGIVRILDSGLHEGRPWYAMELLQGQSLRALGAALRCRPASAETPPEPDGNRWWTESLQWPTTASGALSKGAVPVSSGRPVALPPSGLRLVLTLLRRLCEPLAFLHGEGIVHRDLKPDNILIRTASGEQRAASSDTSGSSSLAARSSQLAASGWPVIVDFGLAQRFGGELSRESLEPAEALTVGTAAYMSPEQVRGDLLDARADLYSLGCILHELLTGVPPFTGVSARQMLHLHLSRQPLPPSASTPGLPAELDALVLRLLAKAPHERLGHALDVARALEALGAEPPDRDGLPAPRAYLYRSRLAGRSAVLSALEPLLDRLEDGGGGGLALLRGESGVGKTRLLLELARDGAERGVQVFSGNALPLGAPTEAAPAVHGLPLQLFVASLEALADRCQAGGREQTERLLGPRGPLLAAYVPRLRTLPGQEGLSEPAELPPEASRSRLFAALAETLEALAIDGPLLLLLDDLQWADELSLEMLELLHGTRRLERAAVLAVGAFRVEEAVEGLRPLWASERCLALEIGRLEPAAVGAVVCDMLALPASPEVFVRFLAQHSEGNPFFVAEYLRTAVAEGLLYRGADGRWQVRVADGKAPEEADYEALPLPRSLRDLVLRHLEGLSAETKGLLEMASVLGREMDEALLAELAPQDETAWQETVHELLHRQLWQPVETGGLRFAHDQIREVAYAGIERGRLRELHRAVAEALEPRLVGARNGQMAMLGHHWEQAGVADRARKCYLAGAREAAVRYAHGEAERLYRACLGLTPEATAESVAVRSALATEVLAASGQTEQALAECLRALAEARKLGLGVDVARLLTAAASLYRVRGLLAEAQRRCEEALQTAREVRDRRQEARTLAQLASIGWYQGRFEEAAGLCEQALALQRQDGERLLQGSTLNTLAGIRRDQGRLEEARRLWRESLGLHREAGRRQEAAVVLSNLAANPDPGRPEEAVTLGEEALALQREIGDRRNEGVTLANLASLHVAAGRPEAARELLEQSAGVLREVGDRLFLPFTLGRLAVLQRRAWGHLQEAERRLRETEALLRERGAGPDVAICVCESGFLALARGDPVRPSLEQARQLVAAAGLDAGSAAGETLARLERAVVAFEAGRPLWRGECPEDVPKGLRRWIDERDKR